MGVTFTLHLVSLASAPHKNHVLTHARQPGEASALRHQLEDISKFGELRTESEEIKTLFKNATLFYS